tara:strand:+ start:3826 stop:3978 length:153 start_codon:yes stop_codon:yes gene_type:complete
MSDDVICIILAMAAVYVMSTIHKGYAVVLLVFYTFFGVIIAMDRFSGGAV